MFGTDEETLKTAIERFDCRPIEIANASAKKAKQKIDYYLGRGLPIIACGEQWDHWALVCGLEKKSYLWIDSDKRSLVGKSTWKKLRTWLECQDEEKPFYAIAVEPKEELLEHSLVIRMRDALPVIAGRANRSRWGQYLNALNKGFSGGETSAQIFFSERTSAILSLAKPKAGKSRVFARRLNRLAEMASLYRMSTNAEKMDETTAYLARQVVSLS